MLVDYLFMDVESGEEFFVECEEFEEAKSIAETYFEKPRFLYTVDPEMAEMMGFDTY